MQGRKPKPTHLKVIAGNPGKRPLNDKEPKPKSTIPACPEHLEGEAKKEWRRMSKRMHSLGLLTEIDKAAFAAYCIAWGRWVEAEDKVRVTGAVIKTKTGYPIINPYLAVANKAMDQLKAFLSEFGMTPSSRSRVKTELNEEDEDESYFD